MESISVYGWRRSSRCSQGSCVEVARRDHDIFIRDSKSPDDLPQRYSQEEWAAFLTAVKAGEFDDL